MTSGRPLPPGRSVLVVGTFDPDYPRNRQMLRLLERLGARTSVRRVQLWGSRRYAALGTGPLARVRFALRVAVAELGVAWRVLTAPRPELIVVLFPGQVDAVVVGAVARLRRVPVVLDWFISLADTMVTDRKLVSAAGGTARLLAGVDRLAARLATLVLADTEDGAHFVVEHTGVDPAKVVVLPIRPDPAVFTPLSQGTEPTPGRVLFYGTFIPLHGIDTIVAASREPVCAGLDFHILGDGQEYERLVAEAKALGAPVTFCPPVAEADLPARIASAEVCLGIFGTSAKASRVVPNKVLECLAVGRPVITADTPAIASLGDAVLRVPPGDPGALAAAVAALHADPDRRAELVRRGWELLATDYDEAGLAASLASAVGPLVTGDA